MAEALKARANVGVADPMWFYRDQAGTEVDLVVDLPGRRVLVEAKSAGRVAPDGTGNLQRVAKFMAHDAQFAGSIERLVVYGGDEDVTLAGTRLLPWSRIHEFEWC